ncbi:polysaccharide deacetylase [Methylovirgula ligni]|uniref:Chitooligosaccharide deacetylase n=1 Tax=Methylovirgula ligni TaxID=569860 RepID=A0A3D9YZ89_9HYPH|nr:polysaccharide deacetylase family protein [Methylovirgula ligni]REF84229.1 polysaccharide deacetylase [Methylovirgula ligni]
MAKRNRIISSGFGFFRRTRLHQLAAAFTRGSGAILMFHQVRPWVARDFAPNRLLEITPDFLDAVLTRLKELGFAVVDLDRALTMIANRAEQPFAVLTFDDGYKDTRDFALPILEKHAAPFTMYVTTGFAERTARLWWVELEEAIARLPRVKVSIAGRDLNLPASSAAEKSAAFATLYQILNAGSESDLLAVIAGLAREAGVDPQSIPRELCLDWAGIEAMARNPLCTIGVHTLTHPRLGKLDECAMREELAASRAIIEAHIGRPAPHLAYPVGNPVAAGEREFQAARELGFKSAVTTRPGMIFPAHDTRRTALPRLSINGNWQSLDFVEILLSGAPFALWNKGRLVA